MNSETPAVVGFVDDELSDRQDRPEMDDLLNFVARVHVAGIAPGTWEEQPDGALLHVMSGAVCSPFGAPDP